MFAIHLCLRGSAGVVEVAFTDRHGGVSSPPYDSLDLSGAPDRLPELAENSRRVARALGVAGLTWMRQAHGREVMVVSSADSPSNPCDAMVTSVHHVALSVRVADCVPVVLADADHGVVGVVHAGRAGVLAHAIEASVSTMRRRGAHEIEAWVGPHVCGGCYEVPAQLRDEVSAVVPAAYSCTTWGSPSLDLGAAVGRQLMDAGCRVTDVSSCTLESPELFSFRRDSGDSGRCAGIVVLKDLAV